MYVLERGWRRGACVVSSTSRYPGWGGGGARVLCAVSQYGRGTTVLIRCYYGCIWLPVQRLLATYMYNDLQRGIEALHWARGYDNSFANSTQCREWNWHFFAEACRGDSVERLARHSQLMRVLACLRSHRNRGESQDPSG